MLVIDKSIERDMWEAQKLSIQLQFDGVIKSSDSLESNLAYLSVYACHEGEGEGGFDNTRVFVAKDFAPYSFGLTWYLKAKEGEGFQPHEYPARDYPELVGYRYWLTGGLIFHGKHDNGGDGGAPTFSVSLTSTSGWSVHT